MRIPITFRAPFNEEMEGSIAHLEAKDNHALLMPVQARHENATCEDAHTHQWNAGRKQGLSQHPYRTQVWSARRPLLPPADTFVDFSMVVVAGSETAR